MLHNADAERLVSAAGLEGACLLVHRLDRPSPDAVAGEPERPIYPASMLKTPLALAALHLVAHAGLSLGTRYAVEADNMTVNDKPSPLEPGYAAPLSELIELALTRSDNVATNMLYDIIGRERATQICREVYGLHGTAFYRKLSGNYPLIVDREWDGVHRNTHTAHDAALLFEAIARTRVPFAWYLHQTLARQEWNNKLSAGLAPGDIFAHKTGDTDEVTHDGGILHTAQGAAYVIVAYAAMPSSDENNARFRVLMRTVRDLL